MQPNIEQMHIKHKNATISYTDQGFGPVIFLLHGFLENKEMWKDMIPTLSTTHRLITIDLPGHGDSSCLGYVHTMELMAEAVLAVSNHLEITDLTIIGHSMGGYVGLAFAKKYPHKIKALCLLNSTPEKDTNERKEVRARANEMAKKNYNQLVRMSVANLFDPSTRETFKKAIEFCIDQALKTPVQGYIAGNTGMSLRPEYTSFWKESSLKKGMIIGTNDWIIDATRQERILKQESDWFRILEGGHMLHITNCNQTIDALKKFLLV